MKLPRTPDGFRPQSADKTGQTREAETVSQADGRGAGACSGSASEPVVSVIMNCRNSAAYLRPALDGVVRQTFTDWEIVFWDNVSTDESPEIVRSYTDPRIRYFRADEPTDLGAARNLAIARSRGRYLAFLDCDDLWAPEKLEKQVALFETNPAVGLACTDTVIFSGQARSLAYAGAGRRMFSVARPHRGMAFAALMTSGWISMSSAMVRRAALDRLGEWFDPAFNVAEEADLFYRIAHDWELDYVDAPLTGWRVHRNNTTFARIHEVAAETRRILEKHQRLYPHYERDHADVVALLSRRAAFQSAVALWRGGNAAAARQELVGYPRSLKFRLFWCLSWLPGSLFLLAGRVYQFLPGFLRR